MSQQRKLVRFRVPAIVTLFLIFVGLTISMFARPLDYCSTIDCANICSLTSINLWLIDFEQELVCLLLNALI